MQNNQPSTLKRRKFFWGTIITLCLLVIAASVFAFNGPFFKGGPPGCKRLLKKLQLTTAQKIQLRGIFRKAHQERLQDRIALQALHTRLLALAEQEKPNPQQLDALVIQGLNTFQKIVQRNVPVLLQVHHILTAAQRQEIYNHVNSMEKRKAHFHKVTSLLHKLNLSSSQKEMLLQFVLNTIEQHINSNNKMNPIHKQRALAGIKRLKALWSKLALTEDQQARLQAIFRAIGQDQQQNRALFQPLRQQGLNLLLQEKPDAEQLQLIISQGFVMAKRIALSKTPYLLQLHNILSPAQRQLIIAEIKYHQAQRKSFMNKLGADKADFIHPVLQ